MSEELSPPQGSVAENDAESDAATVDRATHVPRRLGLALVVIAAAQLMIVLDATIVNVALPQIQRALGFSGAGLEWIVTAYSLAFGSLLLLGGRLGDLYGRRRVFITGIAVFSVGSLLGGFATTEWWLLAARARAGRRRRPGRADRAGPDRDDVPHGRAAQQGARRVRRHERRRRRHRPAARRHPDHLRVVALGVLRQRAHRPDRGRAWRRSPWSPPARLRSRLDIPGVDHQHGRPGAARLRPHARRRRPGRRVALGRPGDDRRAGRRRRAARRLRLHRAAQRIRSCRCTCSRRAAARAPTS